MTDMKRQIKILGLLFLLFGFLKADKCNIPIEIAVVVDVSDSVSVSDYPAIKNFIKTIANLFHISPHSSHLSVVTAGDFVKVPITFKSSSHGKKKLLQALEGLKDTGGSWSLDRAFSAVKEKVFSKENGARSFLPHIAIVITNTVSQKQGGWSALAKTANELHHKKMNVYSIGVGNGPSFNELRLMVKDDSQVHHVDSFKDLINLAPELSADICKDNEDVLNVCQTPVDIGFIVDSSGSINPYGYNNVKNFLKGISVLMGFKPDRTHIGVVLYSKVAKVAFKFGEHPHLRKLFRSIHNLPHWKDRTRIDLGLQTANNSLFTKEGGMRENVTKIAILLTDGEQTTENINDLIPLRVPANALKRRGITIFVIGIGKFFNRKQLLQIVDRRDQLIETSTFTELEEKVNDIATASCQQNVGVFIDFTNRVYNVTENEKAVVEIAVKSGYVNFPVTIGVWTIPATAAQEDFVGFTKNITFQPGETGPKLIEIDVIDDDIVEPTEAFTVILTSPVAVELGEPATVNIIDNDVPRICGSEKDDCHEYATCTDTGSGTHECTCNEGYTGDGWTCKGVVIDFTKRSYNVMENEKAMIEIAVTSGQVTKPMTVSLTTSPLTAGKGDYIKWTGNITFQPGETRPKSIEIEIIDDLIVENTEAFSVILAASKSIRLGQPVTVNIIDNDEAVIDFEKRVHNVKENEKAVLRIVVTSGQINIPVTISVATIPSTAGENDFFEVNESITFQTGEIGPKLFPIELVDDLEVEPTETFIVSLTSSAPVKLGQPATVNILDNDVAKICGTNRDDCHVFASCTDTHPGTYECDCNEGYTGDGKTCTGVVIGFTKHVYNVKENEKAVVEITVTSGQVTTVVAVNVTSHPLTAGNDDFTAKTQSITFQPGETGPKLIEVDLVDDALVEPTEAFTVFLGTSATQVTLGEAVTINIIDNDVGKICGSNKDDCHISASCTDIGPGTYECACNEGYTGDGKICTVAKICHTNRDDCHVFATCTDSGPGMYECTKDILVMEGFVQKFTYVEPQWITVMSLPRALTLVLELLYVLAIKDISEMERVAQVLPLVSPALFTM